MNHLENGTVAVGAPGSEMRRKAEIEDDLRGQGPHLFEGDCLEVMKQIPRGSVDLILCDLPYGTTRCAWDSLLPLDALWLQYKRLIREDGAVVLTAAQPFTTVLINSAFDCFRYAWVWNKFFAGNFVQAKRMPLRTHEDVLVFSTNGKTPRYFPQMTKRDAPIKKGGNKQSEAIPIARTENAEAFGKLGKIYDEKHPITILDFSNRGREDRGLHPTQKPIGLMEYLIRTYTNEKDSVLDNCMGSGSTGVACARNGRKFIGIEQDPKYFQIAKSRIDNVLAQKRLEGEKNVGLFSEEVAL
jgi:site-specific DNA-methyltransferase (adenine-specific)